MIPSHYRELSEDERIGRIAELFSLAVERYWRDARLTRIFEGTSEIQQRIISDQLLGRTRDD